MVLERGIAKIQTQAVSFSTTSISIWATAGNESEAMASVGMAFPTENCKFHPERIRWGRAKPGDHGSHSRGEWCLPPDSYNDFPLEGSRNQKSVLDFSKIYLIILPEATVQISMVSTVLSSEVAKVWAIWVTPVCTRGHRTQLQSPCAVNVGPTWSSLRAGRSLRIENPLSCSLYPRLCVRVSCSVVSDSSWPNGLQPARLLCPWTSPGKNNEVDSHSLLPGIFPTQESNLGLLHCRQILCHLSHFYIPY